jgi:hypothetical protein
MIPKKPTAPIILSATAGDRQVSLSWTPSPEADSYSIYRRPTLGAEGGRRPIRSAWTVTSFTDTGLTNGCPYSYVVTACNASGESDPSNEVSATPCRLVNRFGIPQEVERRLRQKFKDCAHCRQPMKEHTHEKGCPSDKATIEHLNRKGPFYWREGLKEEDLVLCCGSCNSSRGTKRLVDWFQSPYCVQKGITAGTVADEVQRYLLTPSALE